MGRPREHDEGTAAALLVAAERIVGEDGPDALSVRRVASAVGTTTRAVYSLFGSKDGLIVALGAHAFDLLGEGVKAIPATDAPAADLVEAGLMFRRFATTHPSLFVIGVQRELPASVPCEAIQEAANASLLLLKQRIARLADNGGLGGRSVDDATLQFHALCEGLATIELRGMTDEGERMWREALEALIAGFAVTSPARDPSRG
jgi:AcrR family transcriptional regulator